MDDLREFFRRSRIRNSNGRTSFPVGIRAWSGGSSGAERNRVRLNGFDRETGAGVEWAVFPVRRYVPTGEKKNSCKSSIKLLNEGRQRYTTVSSQRIGKLKKLTTKIGWPLQILYQFNFHSLKFKSLHSFFVVFLRHYINLTCARHVKHYAHGKGFERGKIPVRPCLP